MFCFQCEQTAGCTGCTGKAGVCGKKSDTAGLQDKLTGALIGLARATDGDTRPTESTMANAESKIFLFIPAPFTAGILSPEVSLVDGEKERRTGVHHSR